jgi:hypothetical protein
MGMHSGGGMPQQWRTRAGKERTLVAEVGGLVLLAVVGSLDRLALLGVSDGEDASDGLADDLELRELGRATLAGDLSNTELQEVRLEGIEGLLELLGGLAVQLLSLVLNYSGKKEEIGQQRRGRSDERSSRHTLSGRPMWDKETSMRHKSIVWIARKNNKRSKHDA